jgi:isopenicillin-N epimerase
MALALKSHFLLDPTIIFLNHGSFGACPKPVFEEYQRWQRELERQPVEFLGRRATTLLADARAKLTQYLTAAPDSVIYFPNPTTATNVLIRSMRLVPGDEVLTTDHEYGALDRAWHWRCRQIGARYVKSAVRLPMTTAEEFVEAFWSAVTPRTRAIFISHITSPTALILPIYEICRRARAAGIVTIIDGAHAPGHIALNLSALDPDFYVGAAHKWLSAPKGSAFLYARPALQAELDPLVISWGWGDELIAPDMTMGETEFVRFHQWQGTRDLAAFLATPAAIEFQARHGWDRVRQECHRLASEIRQRIEALTGLPSLSHDTPEWFGQMVAVRLPEVDVDALKRALYERYHIEVPVFRWNDQPLMRVSFQGYNDQADSDALVEALRALL